MFNEIQWEGTLGLTIGDSVADTVARVKRGAGRVLVVNILGTGQSQLGGREVKQVLCCIHFLLFPFGGSGHLSGQQSLAKQAH